MMVAKVILFVCAQALVLQSISGQFIEGGLGGWGAGLYGYDGLYGGAGRYSYDGLYGGAGLYGYDGLYGGAGTYGYDGLYGGAGLYGFDGLYGGASLYGYDGLYGGAGLNGYDGLYGGAGLYGYDGLNSGAGFYGGALPVASGSGVPASGVSVLSENVYSGELAVRGALPFLGTVTLGGELPTIGAGAVAYGCGNGAVSIVSEDIGVAGIGGPFGYGIGGYGYDAGFAGPYGRTGCGYGAYF